MTENLILKKSITINASLSKAWKALTDPEQIKKYFFGTEVVTDWKKGSPIIYRGVWQGKPYKDKGTILDIENEKFIYYNYWSSFSGTADKPENYANIRYELSKNSQGVIFTITQDGIKSQELLNHSGKNWDFIMDELKKLLEA